MYDDNLPKNDANHPALTPLSLLDRTATAQPDRMGLVYGDVERSWREIKVRCTRLASALNAIGVGKNDTVAALLPNVPELLELHFAVPMTGAVLNAQNTRLDARTIAFMLDHAKAKVFFVDEEYHERVSEALRLCDARPVVINVRDPHVPGGRSIGEHHYEALLATGDENYQWRWPTDEWDAIALNYTSGTTGNPKGVVYHHRGAFLNALSNALGMNFTSGVRYLWTLPMFHCNGWCFPWAVTAVAGTHICLRQPTGPAIFDALSRFGATHFCGAPIVLNMLVNAPESDRRPFTQDVIVATGGAAPPAATIEAMEKLGIHVVHLYGLTETYGPSTICEFQDGWQTLDLAAKAEKVSRQGIVSLSMRDLMVADPETMEAVPRDGTTIGELMVRGSTVMKGYLLNKAETDKAFAGGWFHTGDLGVWHEDGYAEIKDRAKDIIISGGENVSSLEVEGALYRHPAVLEAVVVACPDEKWGEIVCAFIVRKPGHDDVTADDIIHHCRAHLAHFKCPKRVEFVKEMPKTSTGKFQKHILRKQLGEERAA